jgi:tripartite-type tricarboxylate transporter receptor subunit TctC
MSGGSAVRALRSILPLVGLGLSLAAAAAADWPTKPVKLVVAYSAGGASDLVARTFGEKLSESLGQQFVVENRTGGSGLIAGESVARAHPDGYTLMTSGMPSHVIAPAMNAARFDPVRDFTHIAYFGGPPNVIVVHASLPVRNFKELLALMRSKPDGVEYASPNVGSVGNMVTEYIAAKEKLKLVHVAYRGGGAAILDVVAGHVKVASMTLSTTLQHIRAGTLRPLAISSAKRVPELPDTPTLTELGYPELVVTTWYSLSGPRGLPTEIVDRLNGAVNKAMLDPGLKAHLARETIQTQPMTPVEFTNFMTAEVAKWAPTIRAMKAKLKPK